MKNEKDLKVNGEDNNILNLVGILYRDEFYFFHNFISIWFNIDELGELS